MFYGSTLVFTSATREMSAKDILHGIIIKGISAVKVTQRPSKRVLMNKFDVVVK